MFFAAFAFFAIVEFFLLIGAFVFAACAFIPPARQYALSAALWCACWGPCVVAVEMLAGLSIAAQTLAIQHWGTASSPLPPLPTWGVYAFLGLIGALFFATVAAWLHQYAISRMTLALFRLYAMFVLAGIGGTIGIAWSVWLATLDSVPYRWPAAVAGVIGLTLSGGFLGFRMARHLRGPHPETLQWITREEFEGS